MIEHICDAWNSATAIEYVATPITCRTAIELPDRGPEPRFAYVSVASPIELVTGETSRISDRGGDQIAVIDLIERLLDGEVAGVVAPRTEIARSTDELGLPDAYVSRRQQLRQEMVLSRFLFRQIGLEEVSAHRGAPAILFDKVADLWSLPLSMCLDPAMLLTLGADRQRYVDAEYTERATDRLPRALGRLHDLGVRSYPRLVIA